MFGIVKLLEKSSRDMIFVFIYFLKGLHLEEWDLIGDLWICLVHQHYFHFSTEKYSLIWNKSAFSTEKYSLIWNKSADPKYEVSIRKPYGVNNILDPENDLFSSQNKLFFIHLNFPITFFITSNQSNLANPKHILNWIFICFIAVLE
ncbi:hypothetical protein ACJX0J_022763, partial [Zea mays]